MQPHSAGRPRDDAETRGHLTANVDAAARIAQAGGADPGHWHLHHIALPDGTPADFTPFRAPDYAEQAHSPLGEWLERLAEILGPDHAAGIAERGRQAEAGG
jgi:hypothetical protein